MDERRNNGDLKLLDDKFNELKNDVSAFTAKVTEGMETTTEYRKSLCFKIEEVKTTISNLPCKERFFWYQSANKQIKWLWTITGGMILAILKDWIEKR